MNRKMACLLAGLGKKSGAASLAARRATSGGARLEGPACGSGPAPAGVKSWPPALHDLAACAGGADEACLGLLTGRSKTDAMARAQPCRRQAGSRPCLAPLCLRRPGGRECSKPWPPGRRYRPEEPGPFRRHLGPAAACLTAGGCCRMWPAHPADDLAMAPPGCFAQAHAGGFGGPGRLASLPPRGPRAQARESWPRLRALRIGAILAVGRPGARTYSRAARMGATITGCPRDYAGLPECLSRCRPAARGQAFGHGARLPGPPPGPRGGGARLAPPLARCRQGRREGVAAAGAARFAPRPGRTCGAWQAGLMLGPLPALPPCVAGAGGAGPGPGPGGAHRAGRRLRGGGGLRLAQRLRLASGAFPPAQDLRFGPGLLPLRASEAPFYAGLARPELLLRTVSLFVSPSFPACVRNLLILNGRRGRTRTCDPLLRRQMLYPPELRAR